MTQVNVWNIFLQMTAKGESVARILQELREMTGAEAGIYDSGWQLMASTACPDSCGNYVLADLPDLVSQPVAASFHMFSNNGQPCRAAVVPLGEFPFYGYLALFDQDDKAFLEPLQAAALAMTVQISRVEAEQQIERRYRNEFIHDVLFNNFPNKEAIIDRGRPWGWDLSQPYAVGVLAPDAGVDVPGRERFALWRQMVSRYLAEKYPDVIMADRSNQLIFIAPQQSLEAVACKGMLRRLFTELQLLSWPAKGTWTFSAGIGRFYPSVTDLYRSFQEAKVAVEISRLLRRSASIAFFDELGILRLMYSQGEQELVDYCQQTLGAVEQYDKLNNSNLLATLTVYINVSADAAAAAEQMYVHVNTLRYRLKKIEELLQQDLKKIEVLANLQIALQVKTMLHSLQGGEELDHIRNS